MRNQNYTQNLKKRRNAFISSTRNRRVALQKANRIVARPQYGLAQTNQIHTINVKVEPTTFLLNSTSTAAGLFSWSFTLNDLPDVASYSAIWDSYRFNGITAVITPVTQYPSPASSIGFAPLVTAIDYDDANVPISYSGVLQYSNSYVHPSNSTPVVRNFTPECAIGTYNGTDYTNKQNKKWAWIDLAYPNTQHYGFKAAIKQSTSTNLPFYYIYFKYSISFRKTR